MTATPRAPRASRFCPHPVRRASLLAAAAALGACTAGDPLAPSGALPASVVLTAAGGTTLASLGDSAIVTPRVLDRDGRRIADARVRWTVRPAGVVHQDAEGVYRAIGNGVVTIVAAVDPGETGVRPGGYWAERIADSVTIEVRQRPARLTLAPVDGRFVSLGAQRQLHARVTDARGHPLLDGPPSLTWRSADPRVVAVDGSGLVQSLGEGTTHVLVEGHGLAGSVPFTVSPRLTHTSCMVVAQRQRSAPRQTCVTLDFIVRERGAGL